MKFQKGDMFVFDIELMKENSRNTCEKEGVYEALEVEITEFGEIITYEFVGSTPVAQCNADWLKKI